MLLIEKFVEDYSLGEKSVTGGKTVGHSDINAFAGLTLDFHPAHIDQVFAEAQFGNRMAHGMLTFSLVTGLACEYNLRAFSYGYDKVRFLRPVFPGDTISATSEVVGIDPRPSKPHGLVRKRYEGFNNSGELVFVCEHILAVERREEGSDA